VVGIIGRNGAGKSTLLKVLSRITKPTTGRVEINGRVGSLLEVGTGFHPELTGRENIYLNGSILGMSRKEIDRKFDEIVAFAEVEKFLDTPVKRYSSGMYVRLAFAVAAHLEPEILVVDEVLAVGDAGFQKKCLRKMRECASSGSTVLLVSHQMNSVRELCDKAVWLAAGKVRMDSTIQDVINEYLDESGGQTQANEWVDLTAMPRVGHGPSRIVRARYEGADSTRPPVSDGSMKLSVEVSVPDTLTLSAMLLEFQLTDKFQNKLLSVTTFERRQPLQLKGGMNLFSFFVEQVHLAPGQYALNLILGDLSDIHDSISSAMWVHIAEPPEGSFIWTDHAPVTRRSRFSVSPLVS
jgi:lipopolysaccharide transport system ATP-binding protein